MASAMGCQAIYLSRSLKEEAQLSEEQAFRAARFLQLSANETDYFLDLIRLSKVSDEGLANYLQKGLAEKAEAAKEVAQRIKTKDRLSSLESQLEYYSSWEPSILHLATSCSHLRTEAALAERFGLAPNKVKKIMSFLRSAGLVLINDGKYQFSGESMHLAKDSALHRYFQRTRRELVARTIEKPQANSLHFSSVFATSQKHYQEIRETLLNFIEKTHSDLAKTESEEIRVLAIDLSQVV